MPTFRIKSKRRDLQSEVAVLPLTTPFAHPLCPQTKKRKTTRINPCNPTIKHSRSHDKDFESQISMQISAPLVAVAVAAARRPGEVDRDSARCLVRAEYQGRSFRVSIENQLWVITYNYAILCLIFLTPYIYIYNYIYIYVYDNYIQLTIFRCM